LQSESVNKSIESQEDTFDQTIESKIFLDTINESRELHNNTTSKKKKTG
jgi:hypothetical protein